MKYLNSREKAETKDNSYVPNKEQWKRFKSMEINKLDRKKE